MNNKFSYSQALLAIAISYFAYSLLSISQQIPAIIKLVDKTSPHIDTIVSEVALVRKDVAIIGQIVDKQVPAILTQIETVMPLVERGISQSEQYSQQLPNLWLHLENIDKQMNQLQQALPAILKRIDAIVLTTNASVEEMAKWRPHSTHYLFEIEHSRTDIPKYLTRVEDIIIDAKTIGKEASRGLVSGLFAGALALPFDAVKGLTGRGNSSSSAAKNLTSTDISLMQVEIISLLKSQSKSKAIWTNIDSGNRGTIKKGTKFMENGLACYTLTFTNQFKKQKKSDTFKEKMCLDKGSLWQVM